MANPSNLALAAWAVEVTEGGSRRAPVWLAAMGARHAMEVHVAPENRLGNCSFGVVYRGTWDGRAVACKAHHAVLNPTLYGLDDASNDFANLRGVIAEILDELKPLAALPAIPGAHGGARPAV